MASSYGRGKESSHRMSQRMLAARKVTAGLMVVPGVIIVERGVVDAAPWSFIIMGLGMLALGAYRLWLMRRLEEDRH